MRLLVTGVTCPLTAAVSRLLLQDGHDVVVLATHTPAPSVDLPDGARVELADCADVTAVDLVVAGTRPQACIHLADISERQIDVSRSTGHLRAGASAVLTLIDRLVAHGCERMVVSSSAAVSGTPGGEHRADDPSSPITATGLVGVLLGAVLPWVHQVHGLRWAALRTGASPPVMPPTDTPYRTIEAIARAHVDALDSLATVEWLTVDLSGPPPRGVATHVAADDVA